MESSTTTDVFQPPPEAPVFEPTYEDFEDPIAFITKIRPIVEKVGICKIRPPAEWQPPFVVDVENFKFVPRMQKINELEATTRVKLNFLDKLLKFWELQGRAIKIPTVDRKLLDFHKLHKTVQAEGGYDTVVRERKWSKVATKMNLNDPSTGKCNGGVLRTHYEKYLYPFDLFEAGITVDQNALKEELRKDEELERLDKASGEKTMATATPSSSDASVSGSTSPSSVTPRGRKRKDEKFLKTYSKSPKKDLKIPDIDYTANSELKKLQFFGAGPKAALPLQISKSDKSLDTSQPSPPSVKDVPVPEPEVAPEVPEPIKEKKEKKWKMRDRSGNWRASYLEDSICVQCERTNNDQQVLVCDACSDAYHMYCLVPPLIDMPKGDWRCPKCVAKECNKPKAAYGFEQAKRPFTLQEFGEMADQFKADYFQMPVHNVPHSVVEREFWRLTTCLEEDLTVHYGADIHALTMGSGFPTKDTKDLLPGDEKYVTSSWNLNNLPIHEKSVLRHVTGDVSGMKVPWCYVGMCFSSFCWHIEDHWSYSVNYMHWGEPKTWYGVPSSHGKQLEDVMKSRAPELFEQSPDLLHHITTIMNPNLLMSQGIPMVRTEQCAGEFIITFPRAYHAGFNQGYNFAEAVNFCPSDWLPFGRECIGQYKLGVYQADQEAFELIPDDERQCVFCKTTCFMSAICCPCKPVDVACLEHIEELCECPASKKVLKYRYTLEEMPLMIAQLQEMAQFYSNWSQQAKSALSLTGQDRLTLPELKKLILEAKEKKYPDTSLLKRMQKVVNEAEQCANLANQLVSRNSKQPLGSAENVGNKKTKLSISELEQFLTQINELPCIIQESALVRSYIQKVQEFQTEAQNSLSEDMPLTDRLNRLYHFGCALDIDLAETSKLQILLSQSRWLDKVRQTLSEEDRPSLDSVYDLMEQARSLALTQLLKDILLISMNL
ncbi:KDM5A [Bugula neritina]|uniref:KDM5A n=1 Tax=Bugula neritina TaxID=10212 RepID=A0A7J7K194_BUGNE|nr:KDM5A [Bugula neritina]